MNSSKQVYIVGAGVSGLIAALELEQAGFEPVILEKSDAVGGRVRTVEVDEYHLDIGFQVLLSAYPLVNKYLDMNALGLQKLASGAQILVNGKRYRIGDPMRDLTALLPTVFANIGSVADKFRILRLNQQLKRKTIEEIFTSSESTTLEYLQGLGFSKKIIDRFFQPFFAGIFLETSLHTSSRMFEFVYKMFGEGYATIPANGIGAISEQLKSKLTHTEIRLQTTVNRVTNEDIVLDSGEVLPHTGVIITGDASALVHNMNDQQVRWKSCLNQYFEVDKTSIPARTIALIADRGKRANNLYAFTDARGREVISVTCLHYEGVSSDQIQKEVEKELRQYCGVSQLKHITTFDIPQALPDLQNLKTTASPSESQLTENIFLAGDVLFNGSLNAAMESGRLAAEGLKEKRQGIFA
ncbi:MAG: FAD-dependent oxidoreductase [Schleiferiaceae bacterium]|nr:FAD-dependent oxidoreductase [Schleiferiaceae bacterium]